MEITAVLLWLCVIIPELRSGPPYQYHPEQIHLSYPGDPTCMTVTWTTFSPTSSVVKFSRVPGPETFSDSATGDTTTFVDGGSLKRKLYIHRVTLARLEPGQQYVYICGSVLGWSQKLNFVALRNGSDWSPRFAIFGDLGYFNPLALPRLRQETQAGLYDILLHVGDFAYDLDWYNALIGDLFMIQMESVAAYVPYMTCPGNHEEKYNFSNYRNRFSMPGNTEGLWYSYDIGQAHIISFSTEVYFYTDYGPQLIANQYRWLERDLQKANRPECRKQHPWIITMGHRPMYCSNDDKDDCTTYESLVRRGIQGQYGLEDLFYKYGVDLELWAHEHSYERLWPIYDYQVFNGSTEAPYVNPRAPVHIITGSAGCREELDPFVPEPRNWSAVRIKDYGYTRMQVINRTHLHLQQISDDQVRMICVRC
ncbi:acid phosphatase type 7 isoform X3 [Ambystoma mexicanum]|uniref:acid phosphatase type 7 isoform X3 n=1 Tax=Ambystoma mexicanum TaxID=8296 RepID=UPI0037E978B1